MRSFKILQVSARLTTFLIDKFIKILWVFSYDPENSYCCQKAAQNTSIRCVSTSVHENISDLENFRVYCMTPSYIYSFFFKCTFYYVLVYLFLQKRPTSTFRSLARQRCVLRISSLHVWNLLMILLRFKKVYGKRSKISDRKSISKC